MTALIPFLPLPGLAEAADPLRFARATGAAVAADRAEATVAEGLRAHLPSAADPTDAAEYASLLWQWPLRLPDDVLDEIFGALGVTGCAGALSSSGGSDESDDDITVTLEQYIEAAFEAREAQLDLTHIPTELAISTARLALHSPANCAWRALERLPVDTSQVTPQGRWIAAAIIAVGFRTIFNRWDASLLLDSFYSSDTSYWQRVLRYCADGNLQSVLDEWLYHLVAVEGDRSFDDKSLGEFARTAATALRLIPANYKARDPLQGEGDIEFQARFALRYGDAKQDEHSARPTEVRAAFNSPFWPFVLVSTSVGQEGIDFHPWCHNLVHWNVPTNPVDFEQRDGRVNRFRGHALRKNVAAMHGGAMLRSANPWSEGYLLAALTGADTEIDGLSPDWVYPGPHKVVREVMPYQLSIDDKRLARVHRGVALYRLTLGQPRQEDLLEMLRTLGVDHDDAERWRIDLRP